MAWQSRTPIRHSEPLGEESHSNPNSHSVLDTESVNADLTTSNLTVNIHIDFLSKQYIINLCKTY